MIPRFALLVPESPETPRERRARRVVEALLAGGLLLSVTLAVTRDGVPANGLPTGGPEPLPERTWRSFPIDLAHDPPWVLRLLPGVGPARAAAIVRDRETNGPLTSVGALVRIPGFGERSAIAAEAAGAIASAREPP